ncbi:pyruvate dehydrogenase complex dihydrolipoamide acetyltransferase [Limibacter armeniacum]|uniref:pyruvate dehydrogenase complex dihydrolipoamide acetyltransferase n=1 Tax=Limibacter armeniacum TaxID=466084 RepID=UPI002FE6B993
MAEVIRMPKMSDTMKEGVIASWLVKEGDQVSSGDILAEVETDKATMELESYEDGTILYIAAQEKAAVPIDGIIAIIGEPGEDYQSLLDGKGASSAPAEETAAPAEEEAPAQEAAASEAVDTSGINAEVIRMPKMSDTMKEGVISSWLVKVGDEVSSGDVLAEVETDKATMELESYNDGTMLYITDVTNVPIDGVIAIIGEAGADWETLLKASQSAPAKKEAAPKAEAPKTEAPKQTASAPAATPQKTAAPAASAPVSRSAAPAPESDGNRVFASPLAKKMAEDKGFNIAMIPGSGENGRVVKRDVEAFVPQPTTAAPQAAPAVAAAPAGVEHSYDEPVSQMRKTIANRLTEAKFTAPHFYLTLDIDMDNAITARKSLNEVSDVKISFNDMVVKAVAAALKKHKYVNAGWMGDAIRFNDHVHVGIAVAVPDGLLVPVVRHADQKGMSAISAEVKDLAKRAIDKKLQPQDWEGSTFTISNLGMFGIEEFTAIINPPNSCILAVGGIKQVPVVKNGQIVPGNVMKVTLSCDHRVVDGAVGSAFLLDLKKFLEDPIRLLA